MKVASIINNYSSQNRVQNFNGLWGLTRKHPSDFDPVLGVKKIVETKYYYPFEGESEEEVKKVVDSNSNAYMTDNEVPPKYMVNECKICTTLPFNETLYNNYRNAAEGAKYNTHKKLVHLSVKDKYTNNKLGEQISARNSVFDKAEELSKKKRDFFA